MKLRKKEYQGYGEEEEAREVLSLYGSKFR